jgi:hypothetical protein
MQQALHSAKQQSAIQKTTQSRLAVGGRYAPNLAGRTVQASHLAKPRKWAGCLVANAASASPAVRFPIPGKEHLVGARLNVELKGTTHIAYVSQKQKQQADPRHRYRYTGAYIEVE